MSGIVVNWDIVLWVIEVDYHSRSTLEFTGIIIVDYCSQSPYWGVQFGLIIEVDCRLQKYVLYITVDYCSLSPLWRSTIVVDY